MRSGRCTGGLPPPMPLPELAGRGVAPGLHGILAPLCHRLGCCQFACAEIHYFAGLPGASLRIVSPMRILRFLCFLMLVNVTAVSWAFERPFPQIAKRGQLSMEDYPVVMIDGKPRRLSAGAWIRNQNNTIDMPVSLRGQRFTVNYTENAQAEIDRVWILSAQEASRPPPSERELLPFGAPLR